MSKYESHKFFELEDCIPKTAKLEDYIPNSKHVYKDEHDSYFGEEIMPENNLEQQQKKNLLFLQRIGSNENIVRFFMCCTFLDNSVRNLTELCDANLEVYLEAIKCNKKIIPLTHQCYSDKKDNSTHDPRTYFKPHSDDLPMRLDLLRQTARGLQYLHDSDIIHRNIHPSKVLLTCTSQNKTVVKLGGFRYSKKLKPDCSHYEEKIDNKDAKPVQIYMAKECLTSLSDKKGTWSKKSDIFAFGILTYYTLTSGKHPFDSSKHPSSDEEKMEKMIICNIEKSQLVDKKQQRSNLNSKNPEKKETQMSMIEKMVYEEPENRLTIEEILYHPTFYTPQKKLEFLLKVRESVKLFYPKKDHYLKQEIDKVLIGYGKKIDLNEIFKNHYYLIDPELEVEGGWQPVFHANGNIKTLLNGLRNKVAHACDRQEGTPKGFTYNFKVMDDSFSHEQFVKIFVTDYFPKLLVDLYNIYRKNCCNYAAGFYPNDCKNQQN